MARIRTLAAIIAAAALPSLGLAGAMSASAGTQIAHTTSHAMHPNSDGQCGWGDGNNVYGCINILGSGLHVDDMLLYAETTQFPITMQVCLTYPNGSHECTPFTWDPPATPLQIEKKNLNMAAGTYCLNVWQRYPDGSEADILHLCEPIS